MTSMAEESSGCIAALPAKDVTALVKILSFVSRRSTQLAVSIIIAPIAPFPLALAYTVRGEIVILAFKYCMACVIEIVLATAKISFVHGKALRHSLISGPNWRLSVESLRGSLE